MRGTRTKSRQQIQDEMDKLNSRIAVSGGGGAGGGRGGGRGGPTSGLSGASASIQTIAPNLVPALRLAVEILREPTFPENDFEQLRKQRIAAIEANRNEPGSLATEALNRALNPYPKGDVRYTQTPDEQIDELKKVTLAGCTQILRRFLQCSSRRTDCRRPVRPTGASESGGGTVGELDERDSLRAVRYQLPAHQARQSQG